jgi:serine/threonine protein phosphatase PrpC
MADVLTSKLLIDCAHCDGEILELGGGTVAVYTAVSPDRDGGSNEDSAAVLRFDESSAVLALADGAGGMRGGAQASSIAIRAVRKGVDGVHGTEQPLRTGILNAFEAANRSVLELGIGAASTLAVIEVQARHVRPYHVGDSLILVVGQRGRIKIQVTPHSPVGYAVKSGLIDEGSAMFHEERHLVSNMLGSADMHIEIGSALELAPRDTVVVASDGLSDNLRTQEIVEIVRKGPLAEAARRLADEASARMLVSDEQHPSKPDDLTFLIFRPRA